FHPGRWVPSRTCRPFFFWRCLYWLTLITLMLVMLLVGTLFLSLGGPALVVALGLLALLPTCPAFTRWGLSRIRRCSLPGLSGSRTRRIGCTCGRLLTRLPRSVLRVLPAPGMTRQRFSG